MNDRYEVTYETKQKNFNEFFELLVCVPLKEIYSNRSRIDLHRLNDELYEYFNTSRSRVKNKEEVDLKRKKVLNVIKSKNYLINRDQFCLKGVADWDLSIKYFFFN